MNHKIHILDSICLPSENKVNEDTYALFSQCLFVLDGATPIKNIELDGYNNLATWFVNKVKNRFELNESSDFIINLKKTIDNITSEYPLSDIADINKPTCTLSAVNIENETLKCYCIGDCSVFVKTINGDVIRLYDNRIEPYAKKTFEKFLVSKKKEIDGINKQKSINALSRNKPNGFWVVGYSGDFYSEILVKEFPIESISKIMLCSDGFSRLFDNITIVKPDDVINENISLTEAYNQLREYEDHNYLSSDFGYVKKHDDVTAILCTIQNIE